MKNFPARLKAARLMNGFSMQDLANKLNKQISKQAIGRYEKGLMQPTSDNLSLLCRALEVKSDYFSREKTVSIEKVNFRKLQRLPMKKQEEIKQRTADYLERYLEIEEILNLDRSFKNPFDGKEIKTEAEVEAAAIHLRKAWNLGENPLFNVVETIEENGIKVFELDTDAAFSGMSVELDDGERIIVLNKQETISIERKRFTALHEVAHQLLKFAMLHDDPKLQEKWEEKMCHYFAGAVLLPANSLRNELGKKRYQIHIRELKLLKEQYGISMQAILYRAKNLGIINDYHLKQQMITFSRLGYRKNEPGEFCGKEHSNRFLQLILRGIAEEIITTSKAAALYNVRLAEFRKELHA